MKPPKPKKNSDGAAGLLGLLGVVTILFVHTVGGLVLLGLALVVAVIGRH
jgi:hypothetical protein